MEGSRSHPVKVQLVWHDRAFRGSTVVEAATVKAAIEATVQLLLEMPDPSIVDRAVTLNRIPWAPEDERTVGTVTITAPTRRKDSWATLTWAEATAPGPSGRGTRIGASACAPR
jgi:hypothetical protein